MAMRLLQGTLTLLKWTPGLVGAIALVLTALIATR